MGISIQSLRKNRARTYMFQTMLHGTQDKKARDEEKRAAMEAAQKVAAFAAVVKQQTTGGTQPKG